MNARTKENLGLVFKSLVNNETAIEGARHRGWWWAIIMGIFSIVVSAIPTLVNYSKQSGSAYITNNAANMDVSLRCFVESLNENNVDMIVRKVDKKNAFLVVDDTTWSETYTVEGSSLPRYQHKNNDNIVDLEVYYASSCSDLASLTKWTSTNVIGEERSTSYLVFGHNNILSGKYSLGKTEVLQTTYGDYLRLEDGFNIRSLNGNKSGITGMDANQLIDYKQESYNNLKKFFADTYETSKIKNMWTETGIVSAVNYVFMFIMGLIIFLFTRGKNNPYKIYTFWETQKICYWASPACAVIGCIISLITPNFALMGFAMIIALRMMWLNMKNLRIDYSPR